MARNIIGPWLLIAIAAAAAPIVGCQAHAEFTSGSQPATPATPPPPPAPTAAAPAPAPTPEAAPAPEPEPAKANVTMKDGKLTIPGNIVYEVNKAVIKPESEPTLTTLKDYINQNSNFTRIRIEGHTDNTGTKDANMKLSVERAVAVVDWLAAHGIPKDRLLAVGFGDTRPIADNKTEDGKAQNRRTEFHIAEIGHGPFLGRDATGGGTVAPGQAPVASKKK